MGRSRWWHLVLAVVLAATVVGCRREVMIPEFDPGSEISEVREEGAQPAKSAPAGGQAAAASGPTRVPVTPSPTPTRVPPSTTATTYTVQRGDTLLRIAALYGTTVESLMRINNLANADQLTAGQVLQVSMNAEHVSPSDRVVPDSEVVYGPGHTEFDVAEEVARHPGLLNGYVETVGVRDMTGAEIVDLVAQQYSVGPRVLLALLELRGGWLSNANPTPTQQLYPLGFMRGVYWEGLYRQLSQAANALNTGFYGWWLDELWLVQTADGGWVQFSPDISAGTAAVQKALADTTGSYETLCADLAAFMETYVALFGDPFDYAVEPLIPPQTEVPALALPWPEGETWYYTGGPHPGWGTLGAFSAVDFVTGEENIGCQVSTGWVTAAADGLVVVSEDGMVLQDLDGDGAIGTGWVILYMHIAADGRVEPGAWLNEGERVGHPSCEGGVSNASHVHIARRLNGVWIPTDDERWPMMLSGWMPVSTDTPYEGTLVRDGEVRTACECWDAVNAVTH
ncbi:MAG: LysM peptidoglycan-binding domain-containing protein [Anaerolineae bacterium]